MLCRNLPPEPEAPGTLLSTGGGGGGGGHAWAAVKDVQSIGNLENYTYFCLLKCLSDGLSPSMTLHVK